MWRPALGTCVSAWGGGGRGLRCWLTPDRLNVGWYERVCNWLGGLSNGCRLTLPLGQDRYRWVRRACLRRQYRPPKAASACTLYAPCTHLAQDAACSTPLSPRPRPLHVYLTLLASDASAPPDSSSTCTRIGSWGTDGVLYIITDYGK